MLGITYEIPKVRDRSGGKVKAQWGEEYGAFKDVIIQASVQALG